MTHSKQVQKAYSHKFCWQGRKERPVISYGTKAASRPVAINNQKRNVKLQDPTRERQSRQTSRRMWQTVDVQLSRDYQESFLPSFLLNVGHCHYLSSQSSDTHTSHSLSNHHAYRFKQIPTCLPQHSDHSRPQALTTHTSISALVSLLWSKQASCSAGQQTRKGQLANEEEAAALRVVLDLPCFHRRFSRCVLQWLDTEVTEETEPEGSHQFNRR